MIPLQKNIMGPTPTRRYHFQIGKEAFSQNHNVCLFAAVQDTNVLDIEIDVPKSSSKEHEGKRGNIHRINNSATTNKWPSGVKVAF